MPVRCPRCDRLMEFQQVQTTLAGADHTYKVYKCYNWRSHDRVQVVHWRQGMKLLRKL